MSRTLRTKWLIPEGLTASAGASGTSAILSVIAALPNLGWYLVLPRNGSRNPTPQVAGAKPPLARALGSAAIKAVFLVVASLVVQRPAARIERALFFVEAMLLVPISPLALTL